VSKAEEHRQLAAECRRRAKVAETAEERERLLRMERSLLALAENEEWLSGEAKRRTGGL
jgi:hypothetical protein